MTQTSLAAKLRLLRAQHGLTIKDAAARLGVDRHTLRRIELGTQEAQYPTLAKIAQGYEVPVEDLLEEPTLAGKADAPEAGPGPTAYWVADNIVEIPCTPETQGAALAKAMEVLKGAKGEHDSVSIHIDDEVVRLSLDEPPITSAAEKKRLVMHGESTRPSRKRRRRAYSGSQCS
jgi:DNA-binding XRE family transcriptional regulator